MKKRIRAAAVVCICAVSMVFCPAYAAHGAWQEDHSQWRYRPEESSEMVRSAWYQVDGDWYYFDDSGYMQTGWHRDSDGFWYYLNPVSDGTKGKMVIGWQWIDGYCYYFHECRRAEYPTGAMHAGGQTPDGYMVNENGAWCDENGQAVWNPGKAGGGENGKAGGENGKAGGGKNGKAGGGENEKAGSGESSSQDHFATQGTAQISSEKSEKDSPATPGNARKDQVTWQIYFTDSTTHQLLLAPARTGNIQDGDNLIIYFQEQIVDAQNRIWKSREQSPYEVTITGPQNRVIYIEYQQAGELPDEQEPWQQRRKWEECMEAAREQEALLTGMDAEIIPDSRFLVDGKSANDLRLISTASGLAPGETAVFYVVGKNYVPEGTILASMYGNTVEYSYMTENSITVEDDTYEFVRFHIHRKSEEKMDYGSENRVPGEMADGQIHWKIGDVIACQLDGIECDFRCIDQNYGDETDRTKQKALFLCDSVIPADFGSRYELEKQGDGTYQKIFYPGPITVFGDTNEYKYSNVRQWLTKVEGAVQGAEEIPVGVAYAYEGSTSEGSFEQLEEKELRPRYIGSQKMADHLFLLSLDEALKYREWLWTFEGSEENNPQSQYGGFCRGYWLRTPVYGDENSMVYIVDLLGGNIHPHDVKPVSQKNDQEIGMTAYVGVRPAFTIGQYSLREE